MRAWLLVSVWLLTISTVRADVTDYFLSKGNIYAQTNSGASQPYAVPWIFHGRVTATAINVIQDAWITNPSGFRDGLIPRGTNTWNIVRSFSSQSGFNPFYTDTNWQIIIQTASAGSKTNTLPLFVPGYPPAPHIANYDPAQNVNPTLPFTLTWDAWPGGTPSNLISLIILHRSVSGSWVYHTSTTLGDGAAIPGTATSLVIPAGTLQPGKAYLARLRFDNVLATNLTNYPATGFASSFASTDFYLKTSGATDETPPRTVYVNPPEGAVVVSTISSVTWAFSKPMLTNSLSFQLPSLEYRRTYSPERFMLTLTPTNGSYSQTTQIRWRLNLWDDSVALADTDGNPLMPEHVGTFVTGTTTNLPPPPIAPAFVETTKSPGQFLTSLHGETNRSYLVLAKTNLNANPTNWSFVTVGQATNGSLPLSTNASSAAQRFFRAIALP